MISPLYPLCCVLLGSPHYRLVLVSLIVAGLLQVCSLASFRTIHSIAAAAALAASSPLTALHAKSASAFEEFSGFVVDGGGGELGRLPFTIFIGHFPEFGNNAFRCGSRRTNKDERFVLPNLLFYAEAPSTAIFT